MPHTVRVGDKFRLLGKEWTVKTCTLSNVFLAKTCRDKDGVEVHGEIYLPHSYADSIDWIKPVPKCSKEFADLIKKEYPNASIIMSSATRSVMDSLHEFIDAHTED